MTDHHEWATRGECAPWPAWLAALYIVGQLMIVVAYIGMPMIFMRRDVRQRSPLLRSTSTAAWMGAFVLLCGGGHLLEGVGAWLYPNYYLFTAWNLVTGIVSLGAMVALWSLVVYLHRIPTPEMYNTITSKLVDANNELAVARDEQARLRREMADMLNAMRTDSLEQLRAFSQSVEK